MRCWTGILVLCVLGYNFGWCLLMIESLREYPIMKSELMVNENRQTCTHRLCFQDKTPNWNNKTFIS